MSHKSNRILQILEDVENIFQRTERCRYTEPLPPKAAFVANGALTLWVACVLDSSSDGHEDFQLDQRWLNTIARIDLDVLLGVLKMADSMLTNMQIRSYKSFKHSLRTVSDNAGIILSPLKSRIVDWVVNTNPVAFSALHQCFVFLDRLNLPGLTDLQEKAIEDYVADESVFSRREFLGEEDSLESSILATWFPATRRIPIFGMWNPSHGKGSVSDLTDKSLYEKYHKIGTDPLIRYLDLRLPKEDVVLPRPRCSFERTSKVVFVPKKVDKLRTISMEPTTLMWYQQGFRRNIVKFIKNSRYLSRRIDFQKQYLNRDLAWEGSVSGQLSTIDLSAASDAISYRLLKKWFRHTSLIAPLMATRSVRTELPNGMIIKLDKFAPMGSDLCFPIMSVVFACIIEATIQRSKDSARTSLYRVYGDDLVLETKYVPALIERFQELGFKVNTSKSYTTTTAPYFRESCGGEYLDGNDVTPVRISRRFSGLDVSRRTPSRIEGLVEMCNDTYVSLPSIRRLIIKKLNQLPIDYRVRFDDSGESGIFSPTPTNYHLGQPISNPDLQAWYRKCGRISVKTDPSPPDGEDIRLYEHLRLTRVRENLVYPEDRVTTSIGRVKGITWSRGFTRDDHVNSHARPSAWDITFEEGSN